MLQYPDLALSALRDLGRPTPSARARNRCGICRATRALPAGVAVAPGRVNLIGDHTDYNEGFVLPMALGLGVAVAFAPRDDDRLRVHSEAHGETREASLSELRPLRGSSFFDYVAGVAWALAEAGSKPRGLDAVVSGNLPIGSGLSSSAALELAAARAFAAASAWTGMPWPWPSSASARRTRTWA